MHIADKMSQIQHNKQFVFARQLARRRKKRGASQLSVRLSINGIHMIKIEKIIPHIPTTDMKVTQKFFVSYFEFHAVVETEYFVELNNNNFTLGLLKANGKPNEQSIYIQVCDIEKLWENLKSSIMNLKHKELFAQQYGMKEFHVIIPKTETLLIVGEPVHEQA